MTYLRTLPLAAGAAFGLMAGTALAQTVLATNDGIIRNSLCVGFDCANAEAFGDNTIRMKENNLRVEFDDTSVGAFAANDWRIVANASNIGGDSFLAFQDATANRFPFVVRAGAPANALYVDSIGRVGLGTNLPAAALHTSNGNTPTLRLAQNGSSGFAARTWDIAGNETNFFIRDVTGGSALPFRIRPGAPTSAIDIAADGDVGIGTGAPSGKLHTKGSGVQLVYFESTDNAVQVRMRTNSQNRRFLATNAADEVKSQIVFNDNSIQLAGATNSGANLWAVINANGITTLGPDCTTPCDAVFDKEAFTVPPIEERAAYMWENKHLPAVGPTGPDQPFNLTEKTAGMLHELEIAHIYIEQLNARVSELEALVEDLR